jgi:hypothetical protein
MAQVNLQSYQTAIVYNDLALEETLQDTFHSLEHLNVIMG